jgi:protein TonB
LEAAAPAARPATVSWAQRPTARRIAELYPDRAIRQGVGGRVQLDCVVQVNLSVACTILSENPPGLGFGRAALSAAGSYRAQPQLSDGASAIGKRARISVNFQAPQ